MVLTLRRHTALGKGSLAVRFVDGYFVDPYYATIDNTFYKPMKIGEQTYGVEIVDTAGQVSPCLWESGREAISNRSILRR